MASVMLLSCKRREVPTMAHLSGALLRYSKPPYRWKRFQRDADKELFITEAGRNAVASERGRPQG